jgi:hypothetical protein
MGIPQGSWGVGAVGRALGWEFPKQYCGHLIKVVKNQLFINKKEGVWALFGMKSLRSFIWANDI